MNLARRFNRGPRAGSPRGVEAPGSGYRGCRRVATIESSFSFRRRYATRTPRWFFPALKGRAKLTPTLRVEKYLIIASKS
jgi:hypothetical protein